MAIRYALREDLLTARDINYSPATIAVIDQAIESASRKAEDYPLRVFHPTFAATLFYDWPQDATGNNYQLWIDDTDILAIDTLTIAGTVAPDTDYILEPVNLGPPFNLLEILKDADTTSGFEAGDTTQRAIQIDGTTGYTQDTTTVGTLAVALTDTTGTAVQLDTATPDIGNLLVVEDEWMNITARAFLDSTETVTPALAAQKSDNTFAVSDVGDVAVGELIRVDTELMLVTDSTATELVVDRAARGTVLATHSATAGIDRRNSYTVERGVVGSTAATHLISTPAMESPRVARMLRRPE